MLTNETTPWKLKFATIISGQTVSLIGSSAVQFALIWWLAVKSDSALVMALSGLFAFLPQALLGPWVGVWIDRLNRKRIVIIADMFMGIVAFFFALSFYFSTPVYWLAYLVIGVRAVASVFHSPSIQAIVPLLVPKDELVRANGWSQFLQSGALMLGPVLGALMYAALPMHIILATDLLGAIVACITMGVTKIPELPVKGTSASNFLYELKDGALVFIQDKKLGAITIITTLCMVFFMPLASYYPLMTSSYFNGTAWHAGLVELLYAVGMMAASLLVGLRGAIKQKFFMIHLGLLGIGVTALACGLLPPSMSYFALYTIFCCIMGACGNLFNIPYVAYIQETVALEKQGRTFSLMGSLISLSMPAGLLLSGPIAESKGVAFWFFLSGIAVILLTLISQLWIWQIGRSHTASD
ncbi:MAG: MFS transporter [Lachnospiraceae bacterium]